MRKIVGDGVVWAGVCSRRFKTTRPFSSSTSTRTTNTNNSNNNGNGNGSSSSSSSNSHNDHEFDAYRDLHKLDFTTASQILFTQPPPKKKFGLDFHLVQLFFVCMPSLAVYLVAQYARYEMRRMEAELEVKKKADEEAKAKEMELIASEEKVSGADGELHELKARLGKLEEALKEIVVDGSKKQPGSTISQKQEDGTGKAPSATTASEESNSATEKQTSKGRTKGSGQEEKSGSLPVTNDCQQNHKATQS